MTYTIPGQDEWRHRAPPVYSPHLHEELGSSDTPLATDPNMKKLPNIMPNDIVIAVMGITGAGKSTFISHFAPDARPGHSLQSCTSEVEVHPAQMGDQKFYLIDTPGFDDTNKSDTDVLREVANWLNRSYQARIQLAGIVYLHRIVDNRMGGAAMKNLRMFKKLCGEEGLSCVVLATSMWGLVSPEEGHRREHELVSRKEFWAPMISRGSKVLRQDNGVTSAMNIMRYILSQRHRITLEIQKEMASGKNLDETGAGMEVQAQMEALKRKHEAEMKELRKEMEEAVLAQDLRAQQEIAEIKENLKEQMQRDAEDRERMRVNMEQLQEERNKELQVQRDAAHKRELEFQRSMFETKAQLENERMKNQAESQLMETKLQLELKKAEVARWEREKAERDQEGCVVM